MVLNGQNDVLVFVSLELPAQTLSGFPDVAGEVVELGFVECKGHEKRAAYCIRIVLYLVPKENTNSTGISQHFFQNHLFNRGNQSEAVELASMEGKENTTET
jgi:hypothetical protein